MRHTGMSAGTDRQAIEGETGTSDAELVRRVQREDDRDALAMLFARNRAFVYRLALNLGARAGNAEDVVQDTFVSFLKTIKRFDAERGSVRGMLATITVNHIRMRHRAAVRRRKREKAVADMSATLRADASTPAEHDETRRALRQELELLPRKLRLALALRFQEGMPVREIAVALEVHQKTIHARLRKGVELLRRRLTGRGLALSSAVVGTTLLELSPRPDTTPASLTLQLEKLARSGDLGAAPLSEAISLPKNASAARLASGKAAWGAVAILAAVGGLAGLQWVGRNTTPAMPGRTYPAPSTETVPPAPRGRWNFTGGEAMDLKLLKGSWRWERKTAASEDGWMIVPPDDARGGVEHVVVLLPQSFPPAPARISLKVRVFRPGARSRYNATWTDGKRPLVRDVYENTSLRYQQSTTTITSYIMGRWVVNRLGGKLWRMDRYLKPFPSRRLALLLTNWHVDEIEVCPVRMDQVPEQLRDPSKLIPEMDRGPTRTVVQGAAE